MSYKNDSLLVISNKYGKASGDAKAELYETYDKLRDLTAAGNTVGGPGYGATGNFLINLSRLIAPSSFMPILGNQSINIPGTSFSSAISGGNSITSGGLASFGYGNLGTYPGFPGGAAAISGLGSSLMTGIGNSYTSLSDDFTIGGIATGGAASLVGAGTAASALAGTGVGLTGAGQSLVLPVAGVVSGIGGIMSALGPYFGPFGLAAGLAGNIASGYGGAVLSTYQQMQNKIINNADVILSNKIKNIETVCKQLDTQADVVKKMLKESIEGDSKALQNL